MHINESCILYFNDVFEEKAPGEAISLMLQIGSEEEINNLYSALSKNGKVVFPLQKTFWGSFHAVLVDAFGITWNLDYASR